MNSFLKIRIDGLNYNKIINLLIENGVLIENMTAKNHFVIFEITQNDKEKLEKICKKYKKRYKILNKSGFCNFASHLKFYFGTLLSFVICFAFIFSFNMYVYEVNLSYCSSGGFDLSGVEKVLNENNIKSGMKKNEINCFEIQKLILETQDDIAGCTVSRNGGKLEIVVYPGVKKEMINNENIVSRFNAVITKVDVFAGKSKLKSGDIVKVGDTLIENNNGAEGNIFGKVYYSDYIIFNEKQVEKVFTGNVFEFENILLFNKNLVKLNNNCIFLNFTEEKCVFYVSKNLFFDLKYEKIKYREFEYKEKVVSFESVETKLKEELKQSILVKIDNLNEITNVTYSVFREDNLVRLDCFVECEINLTK